MKAKAIKFIFITFGLLLAGNTFAYDLLSKSSDGSREVELAVDRLLNPTDPEEEVKCEAETIGKMVCVLCEYTAIGETTFNCYKIPEDNSNGDLEFSIKMQRN